MISSSRSQTSGTTVSTYRERSSDKTDFDDGNKEESETSNENDESFKEEQSNSKGIDNNDEDEKE